jgi:hypothetical protein
MLSSVHFPVLNRTAEFNSAKPDFAALIGYDAWSRLVPDVRRRFSAHPSDTRPIRYVGVMRRVEASSAGLLIAQAGRLFHTPFAPYRGRDVPVEIILRANLADGEIVWDRIYRYEDRPSALVRSIKRQTAQGLMECVGGGFAMRLAIYEKDGALHFESRRYVWRIAGFTIPLPHFLSPGTAHVIHQDLGDGRFRFSMTIRNRLLGMLFLQDGVFQEEGTAS